MGLFLEIHVFEDDGLFTPCHSDMQGTEGVKLSLFLVTMCTIWHILENIANFWEQCNTWFWKAHIWIQNQVDFLGSYTKLVNVLKKVENKEG